MDYAVETVALTKKYGEKFAVKNMSVHVYKGDIYGLIGKNGAGKTTLMRLILGLAIPDSGEIKLFGGENPDLARRRIGSLIEAPALFKNESAFENMKKFSYLAPATDDEIKRILDLVGIGDTGDKKVGAFSLGMKQRLGLAVALLGNPELLILDEPINGLDPAGIKEIRNIILELNKRGVTFMISSHILDELGKIATRYGVANDGVLEEISAEELIEKSHALLTVKVDDGRKASDVLRTEFAGINVVLDGDTLNVSGEIDPSAINETLVRSGVKVYELKNGSVSLEDYFIERLGR